MDPLKYCVIDIAGEDATAFANAQFSSDVHKLDPGHWQWSSWLDARGRVRALFLLVRVDDARLRLLLRGGDANALCAQLRMFVLRSRVTIGVLPDMHPSDDASSAPLGDVREDDASMVLGFGDYAVRLSKQTPTAETRLAWQRKDIEHGFAWLPDAAANTILSPALSLRRIDATSLTKGCYPGQEIATRLHHRGGNKRHLCLVEADAALAPGSEIHQGDNVVGMTLQCTSTDDGHIGLAVLHERALGMDETSMLHVDTDSTVELRARRRFDD